MLCAQSVSHLDYRGMSTKVQITAERMSPAFAALEDSYAPAVDLKIKSSQDLQSPHLEVEHLYAGAPKVKTLQLPKLTIAKSFSTPFNDALKKAHAALIKNTPIVNEQTQAWKSMAQVTGQITDQIKKIAYQPQLLSSPRFSQPEVNSSASTQTIQIDDKQILIGGSGVLPRALSNQEKIQRGDVLAANPRIAYGGTSLAALSNLTHEKKIALNKQQLTGQIVLTDGAVYPGESFNFYIQRTFDGMTQERGSVDPYTGEFSIEVGHLKGRLSIELRHETGAAIAYGDINLSDIKEKSLDELRLNLYPTEQTSLIGQVLSYESFDQFEVAVDEGATNIHIDGQTHNFNTDGQGKFSEDDVMVGSQVLMSVSHQGYWNAIELSEAGTPTQPVMHTERRMQVVLDLLEPYLPKAKIYSIIWGRVSHEGQPLAGAQVSLQGFEDIQALYFNLRIPNPNATKTSTDGYFAFINPPEGLHIIKTDHAKVKFPMETTVVKPMHTSLAKVESAPLNPVRVKVFDAFDKSRSSLQAQLSIPGEESSWIVSAQKRGGVIDFYDRASPMAMNIDAGSGYVSSRLFINRRRTQLDIPVLRSDWLNGLVARSKINISPNTGMIVGLIDQGAYSLNLSRKSPNTVVIYFNKQGQPVSEIKNGGGFLAVNIPEGLVTTSLYNLRRKQSYKAISLVESHRVSVVKTPASEL